MKRRRLLLRMPWDSRDGLFEIYVQGPGPGVYYCVAHCTSVEAIFAAARLLG